MSEKRPHENKPTMDELKQTLNKFEHTLAGLNYSLEELYDMLYFEPPKPVLRVIEGGKKDG